VIRYIVSTSVIIGLIVHTKGGLDVAGLLNVGGLLLGLIAWILPVVNIIRHKEHDHQNWVTFSIMSIGACAISLCFQIFYHNHLVTIEDWGALMDTTGALAYVAAILLTVTVIIM